MQKNRQLNSQKILKKSFFSGLVLTAFFSLSACSWVQPLPGALEVALMPAEDVTKCQKLGSTHASVLDKVGFYDRSEKAITEDLIAVAKNEAVRMRGDTIVKASDLTDGKMEFEIYRCLK